ncbi:hypothetical protein DL96DRAFT_89837 [Flagelloscypha sp. PMI_526]|nr:hypothetical protein DL96DRAFT_89837 [Flagelloscypha sp. PMI_526]
MRIEELVIDGFKSYPVRTRITGWDSSFNAITGLNGSGKSNILDAICFVLGITNMSAMRAQNQTDLIYKRGTAGVTKASVTVVFNNSERDKSPVGYENLPQITVTRQVALPNVSKYLLNGHKATQNQIQNVFQSVQLNINNPNFVIMQGKITKVLNMKPPEILSLVEEAAGTRMFEDRKEKAKKAMDKKQRKVDELIATLEEEVTPKINKRRKQRDEFLEFQKAASELEKLGQMLTAYEWHQASGKVAAKESDIKAKKATIKEKQADIEKTRAEMKVIEKEIKEVEKRKEAEMKKGGKLAKLRAEQEKLAAAVKELKAQADLKAKDIKNEMGQVNGLESDVAEQQRLLDAKTQEIGKLTASSEQLQQIHATMDEKLQSNEALLQTLLTGVTDTKKNSSGGYIGALQSAQKREADGMAEEKQARNHLSMAENDLKDARKRLAAVQNQVSQNQTQLDVLRKEVQDLQSQLDKTEWTAEKESQLENIVRESRDTIRALSLKRQQLQVQLGRADFQYQPPQNFDTTKVKGTAARLMRLDPTNHDKATALEIAAGAKLFHVVVDDDDTGSRILKECQLKQRVTLIPLNKINARVINDNTLAKCRQFANGKQFAPATSLVQTDAKVQKALPYVFGETIICEDAQAANKITYGAQVRSVTVQGDVYDTGGTLSGGSAPSSSGTLVKIQGLINIDEQLNAAQTAADRAELELKKNERKRSQWRTLGQEMEMKAHELSVLEQQLDGSSASRVQKEVETHEGRIEQARMQLDTAQQKQKEAKVEIKKLEKDMEEFKDNKEGKIEELRVRINKERSQLQKHQVQVSTKKKEVQTASLEKEQIERELDDTSNNISKTKKNIKALEKDAKKLDEE